jgi:hypothetical protein
VTCSGEGCFYSKVDLGFLQPDRPWLLSVQDPLDMSNDTARNSWNIKIVRQVSNGPAGGGRVSSAELAGNWWCIVLLYAVDDLAAKCFGVSQSCDE